MGGEFSEINEFPWAALLNLSSSENGATSRCGGSLISDRFIKVDASIQFNKFLFRHLITAAHCIREHNLDGDIEFEYDNITIILGRYFSPHLSKNFKCHDFPGEHDISDESEAVTFITKAKPYRTQKHGKFYIRRARGTVKYDVAILELENPVDFTNPRLRHIRFYSIYIVI